MKCAHLLFVSLRVGGAAAVALRQLLMADVGPGELAGVLSMMEFRVGAGTFQLGPWLSEMAGIVGAGGPAGSLTIYGSFQTDSLIIACIVSILKPWRAKGGR